MKRYQFPDTELSILEHLPAPLAVYQLVGTHVYTLALSDGFCDIFGYEDRAEAYGLMERDICFNTHPDDVSRVTEAVRRFVTEGGKYEVVFRGRKYHESEYHIIHGLGRHVHTPTGERLAYVWYTDEGAYTGTDETQIKKINKVFHDALHEESIYKSNFYDALTGLPNMSHFFTLAAAGKSSIKGIPALMYIDLNGMKVYNETHGFAEGDKLLQSFARLLTHTFGNENSCHIAADRFAAYAAREGLDARLEDLFTQARQSNMLPIRVGIYTADIEDAPVSTAYDRAKVACDLVPKTDVSGFNYYDQQMGRALHKRQYILSNLDRAISEGWIKVYYQPIVRALNGKVCDEEALARWIDPVNGFMSPADFIQILEETGAIYKLDLYMLEQVLGKMKTRADIVPHSINLSRSDFSACDIVEEIRRRVDDAGIERSKITIEITESVVGSDFDFMKKQIERFRALGFPVWMDDFGSGYSSLDVLQSVKFDLIKFDMGFMRKLDESKILLTELMRMALALGLDTVCEGVETEEQMHFLQEIGCSKLQGYYFCKPIPFEEIVNRYQRGTQIGYEDLRESAYYESIGRINLNDLSVIATDKSAPMTTEDSHEHAALQNAFNSIPMGIIEIRGDESRFVRSNQPYRDFMKRFFGFNLSNEGTEFAKYDASFMYNVVQVCVEKGRRAFYDEKMPDGSVVHSFARKISQNPVTGNTAIAVAVLSITEPSDDVSYAEIARTLAADYYNIYVVNLETDRYIEYTSQVGEQALTMERRGEDFFESCKRDAYRIYEEDQETFYAVFSKEKVIRALDQQGVFTTSYRLMDTGVPMYVNMKVTRMQDKKRIIMGISIIDAQVGNVTTP